MGWVAAIPADHPDPTREASGTPAVTPPVVGRHGREHWFWTPLRVLLVLCTVGFLLSLVRHEPCVRTDWSNDQARYGKMCYSDIPYLYTGRGFAERLWPYSDTHGRYEVMEYPVGISYVAWAAAEVNGWWASGPPQSVRHAADPGALWGMPGMATETDRYFVLTAVVLFCFGLATVWFLAGTHPGRPRDALPFVLSPCLLVTQLINWDLLAVACTAGALWAWQRRNPVLAGVFVGLGTATKLYPLFLLGAFLLVAVRRGQTGWFLRAAAAAACTWIVAQLPAWLTGVPQWWVFWQFNSRRGADLGSLWLAFAPGATPHLINLVSWVVFALACVAIAVLAWRAPVPPRAAQLGFLIVAAFLVVNKVYSPQYVLWLLPLAVLARTRWRELLLWQAFELFYFAAVWWHLGGFLASSRGGETPVYPIAIVLRVVAELALAAVVVRDVLAPRHDPVRQPPRERAGSGEVGPQSISTRSNAVVV